jgi:hypothetical protein
LTITEELIRIQLVGKMEVGSAEVQPARDSQLGVTDYRMGGRFQTDHPTHFPTMVIQNSLMRKKTSLPKARILLTVKGICPIHAEPVHRRVGGENFWKIVLQKAGSVDII